MVGQATGNNARDPGGGIGQVPRLDNWVGGVYITGAFRCTFDAVYDQETFGLREKKPRKKSRLGIKRGNK